MNKNITASFINTKIVAALVLSFMPCTKRIVIIKRRRIAGRFIQNGIMPNILGISTAGSRPEFAQIVSAVL